MKTSIVIQEGVKQIVLTPESEFEQGVVDSIKDGQVQVLHGQFYQCNGGWCREGDDDRSLIIRHVGIKP